MLLGLNGSIIAASGMVATIGLWGGVALAALHTAVGLWILGLGMLALAWYVETDLAGTPRWLPFSVSIGVFAGALGVWRALIVGGYAPLSFLPAVVMGGGCLIAPIFGLTVYLAQRGHAQARALRRSEALLKEAQHLSSTGSFSWRVATDVVTFSEQTYRLHEFDASIPVTLDRIAARIHPEDMPLWHQMINRARGPGTDLDCEYRLQMPDHSVKHLHLVAHGARDKDDQLEYIGAIQDVTTRRLAEEALGKLRSELAHVARVTSLGALTASIAHEVNQPLAGIVTNASTCLRMLAADPPNIDGARETARRTIRDGNRASAVIARLRALFSKKDATNEPIDLNEAAREVIALLLSELQRNRVVLRAELADDLPAVMGDRVQLQQVILNLCLNASDAMRSVDDRPRDLSIITSREDGNRVRLTVQDAGRGFETESLDRLFEAFYTTKKSGMGIGLSVSRSIIESHQGRLWAAPNEGPGATFSFSIPCSPEGVHLPGTIGAIRTPAVTEPKHSARSS
jgi:signal transduction histidine kinase